MEIYGIGSRCHMLPSEGATAARERHIQGLQNAFARVEWWSGMPNLVLGFFWSPGLEQEIQLLVMP